MGVGEAVLTAQEGAEPAVPRQEAGLVLGGNCLVRGHTFGRELSNLGTGIGIVKITTVEWECAHFECSPPRSHPIFMAE